MAISVMKKISVIAAKSDADVLLNKLTWAKSVDIIPAPEGALLKGEDLSYRITTARAIKRSLEYSLGILKPYRKAEKGLFKKKKTYSSSVYDSPDTEIAKAMLLSEDAAAILRDIGENETAIKKCDSVINMLSPWLSYAYPLGVSETESCYIILGSLPTLQDTEALTAYALEKGLHIHCDVIYKSEERALSKSYAVLTVLKNDMREAMHIFEAAGFVRADFGGLSKTPTEESAAFESAKKEYSQRLSELGERQIENAEKCEALELACDLLDNKIEKLTAREKLAYSDYTLLLTGYIPEKSTAKTLEILSGMVCYAEFADVTEEDDPPVKLENNAWAQPFESIVSTYSMPKYGSFDPTFIMSVFYFIIFGLMFADVVYGGLVVLVCLVFARRLELSDGMKKMVKMFGYCGISCIISGIIFGSYLGDYIAKLYEAVTGKAFNVTLGINVLDSSGIIIFIVISLAVGVLHLLTGMGIKFYMLWKQGDKFGAIFDVGSWYVIFAGIGVFVLFGALAGGIVLGVGLLMKVGTAGRAKKGIFGKITGGLLGLYDIIGYASDIISYMRIMALGLSSAVIASVVNIMATMSIGGNPIVGSVLMVLIMILGHTINIALNLLGCYVHTSRLQYIEFFSKFFEDGGRVYKPLSAKPTYTRIADDENINENKK